ncbi:MAG TPA: hypothetical protein VFA74_02855 [Terriglobales bacterium]|nr:hypothetical protein [Terriglobales bacterium]
MEKVQALLGKNRKKRREHMSESLTIHAGVTERYIGLVFGCAFLAPDILEAILEGSQPRDLTFKKLCHSIPLNWAEQRRRFGFPEQATRRQPGLQ